MAAGWLRGGWLCPKGRTAGWRRLFRSLFPISEPEFVADFERDSFTYSDLLGEPARCQVAIWDELRSTSVTFETTPY